MRAGRDLIAALGDPLCAGVCQAFKKTGDVGFAGECLAGAGSYPLHGDTTK